MFIGTKKDYLTHLSFIGSSCEVQMNFLRASRMEITLNEIQERDHILLLIHQISIH